MTEAQALEIYHNASIHELGEWAHARTAVMHPEDYRTYVIDRNINYTNVCTAKCTFCAFRRDHEDEDSYTLSYETIGQKIRERYAGLLDRTALYQTQQPNLDDPRLARLVKEFNARP